MMDRLSRKSSRARRTSCKSSATSSPQSRRLFADSEKMLSAKSKNTGSVPTELTRPQAITSILPCPVFSYKATNLPSRQLESLKRQRGSVRASTGPAKPEADEKPDKKTRAQRSAIEFLTEIGAKFEDPAIKSCKGGKKIAQNDPLKMTKPISGKRAQKIDASPGQCIPSKNVPSDRQSKPPPDIPDDFIPVDISPSSLTSLSTKSDEYSSNHEMPKLHQPGSRPNVRSQGMTNNHSYLYGVGYELLGAPLYKGSFGTVYVAKVNAAQKKDHNKSAWLNILQHGQAKVAVKELEKEGMNEFFAETQMLCARIHHKHIMMTYEAITTGGNFYLIQEACLGGTLTNYVELEYFKHGRGVDEVTARSFLSQLVSGVTYLHTRGICHRDIKPDNIYLDKSFRYTKLTGFGLSEVNTSVVERCTRRGPPSRELSCTRHDCDFYYSAPEVIFNEEGSVYDGIKADSYSLGAVLFFMVNGKRPFEKSQESDQMMASSENQRARANLTSLPWTTTLTAECSDLIQKLLVHQPPLRMTALAMSGHAFITGKKLGLDELIKVRRANTAGKQTKRPVHRRGVLHSSGSQQMPVTQTTNPTTALHVLPVTMTTAKAVKTTKTTAPKNTTYVDEDNHAKPVHSALLEPKRVKKSKPGKSAPKTENPPKRDTEFSFRCQKSVSPVSSVNSEDSSTGMVSSATSRGSDKVSSISSTVYKDTSKPTIPFSLSYTEMNTPPAVPKPNAGKHKPKRVLKSASLRRDDVDCQSATKTGTHQITSLQIIPLSQPVTSQKGQSKKTVTEVPKNSRECLAALIEEDSKQQQKLSSDDLDFTADLPDCFSPPRLQSQKVPLDSKTSGSNMSSLTTPSGSNGHLGIRRCVSKISSSSDEISGSCKTSSLRKASKSRRADLNASDTESLIPINSLHEATDQWKPRRPGAARGERMPLATRNDAEYYRMREALSLSSASSASHVSSDCSSCISCTSNSPVERRSNISDLSQRVVTSAGPGKIVPAVFRAVNKPAEVRVSRPKAPAAGQLFIVGKAKCGIEKGTRIKRPPMEASDASVVQQKRSLSTSHKQRHNDAKRGQ